MTNQMIGRNTSLALVAAAAQAHGAVTPKTEQTLSLNAPVAGVRSMIGIFCDKSWPLGIANARVTALHRIRIDALVDPFGKVT